MGIRKEEYTVIGFKFNPAEINKLSTGNKSFIELLDEYGKIDSKEHWLIYDGMSGNYLMFGLITQLSDGWDDGNMDILEFSKIDQLQIYTITTKFNELFPDNVIFKEIKNYYVPHLV